MSKIICDVCGTSYPETATQCPICGCVRPADTVTVNSDNGSVETPAAGTYTYVKGGRFSKTNVKKRNSGSHPVQADRAYDKSAPEVQNTKSDRGLTITIIVLLLAIIAVAIYIVMHFFGPVTGKPDVNGTSALNTTENTTENTTQEPTELEIPCEQILISDTVVELDKAGAAYLLNVMTNPEDSTDDIFFESSDETVATVTPGGKIVAVGPGQCEIVVTCGDAEAQCRVVCDFETIPDETKEPSTEPSTEPAVPTGDFKLNREDFTMTKKGETWKLYNGTIPVKQITWTSKNEKVVTVTDGVVTAVGTGSTTVYAEFGGIKLSCTVRCADTVGKYVETPSDTQQSVVGKYSISSTDTTLYLNGVKSFTLKLLDSNNNAVDVIWSVADASICSVNGNTVTAHKAGTTTVTATYEGETYSCIIRVRNS